MAGSRKSVEISGGRDDTMSHDGTVNVGKPAVVWTENGEIFLLPTKRNNRDKSHSRRGDEKDVRQSSVKKTFAT